MTEDEMVGWHYRLNGHEFEQDSGVGDGQGSLGYCSPWSHKESDMTERLNWTAVRISSVQLLSRVRLCNPMNRSTPGLPVHHHLPEFTQTHVHAAGDAIQPSHPLSSRFPPASNPSQHQSLFQWVNSLHEYWSFSFSIIPSKETPRTDLL